MLGRFLNVPMRFSSQGGLASLHIDDNVSLQVHKTANAPSASSASPQTDSSVGEVAHAQLAVSDRSGSPQTNTLTCDDEFLYWKRDGHRKPAPWPSPWAHREGEEARYITFEPDHGVPFLSLLFFFPSFS
jgi:hypothetical protein